MKKQTLNNEQITSKIMRYTIVLLLLSLILIPLFIELMKFINNVIKL